MKKIFAIFIFVFLFYSAETVMAINTDFIEKMAKKIDVSQLGKTAIIFSDSSYSQSTHNFLPGQTVYVRVENVGNGDKQKRLLLLDSSKKEISAITLNQSGSGPYLFTSSFKAPDKPGIYYVDIKIDSGSGSVYSSQQNINIGELQAQVSVSSEARSEVKGVSASLVTTVISPTITVTPTVEEVLPPNFVARFFNFFKKFLNSLTF